MWSLVPCAGACLHATITDTVLVYIFKYFSHWPMHQGIGKICVCMKREQHDVVGDDICRNNTEEIREMTLPFMIPCSRAF